DDVRREIHRAEEAADDAKVVPRRIARADDLLSRSERNDRTAEIRNARRGPFTNRRRAFVMMAQRIHLAAPTCHQPTFNLETGCSEWNMARCRMLPLQFSRQAGRRRPTLRVRGAATRQGSAAGHSKKSAP